MEQIFFCACFDSLSKRNDGWSKRQDVNFANADGAIP